jgi:CRISPR-associated exonuclease Cas4
MYQDQDFIQISALQHYVFCKRQCALIHVEQAWAENHLTAEGRVLHESVDQVKSESRKDIRNATAIRLCSATLGLTGVMDMLELHQKEGALDESGTAIAAALPNLKGFWQPFPVEYKRGKPKSHRADEIQLCAQALCLEEMLKVTINSGALFYGLPRRRTEVAFDECLRGLTKEAISGVHGMLTSGKTPPPLYTPQCRSCSLLDLCQPHICNTKSAKRWLNNTLEKALK